LHKKYTIFNIFNLNMIIVQSLQGQSLDYYHWPVYKYSSQHFQCRETVHYPVMNFWIYDPAFQTKHTNTLKKIWYSIYEEILQDNNSTFILKWRLILIISSEGNTKITLLILLIVNYKSGILSVKAWTLKNNTQISCFIQFHFSIKSATS